MPKACKDTHNISSVHIQCRTTLCKMSQQNTGSHIVKVWNKRAGNLYEFEATVSTLNGRFLIDDADHAIVFGSGGKKEIIKYTPFFGKPTERRMKLAPKSHEPPGIDIMKTVVNFYDSGQRQPDGTYFPINTESDTIEYEIELV